MKITALSLLKLLILLFPIILYAQEQDTQLVLETIKNQKHTTLIDSLSLGKFEKLLIPSFAELISDQELVFNIESKPLDNINADRVWINSSLTGGTRNLKGKTISFKQDSVKGSAFGNLDQLSEETDPLIKGEKLLWNIISRQEYSSYYDSESQFSWQDEEKNEKQSIRVRVTNIYPAVLKQNTFVGLRQRFQIIEPGYISDFKFLTIRQYGPNEDLLWFYSPILKKTRELTASLRGDNILDSLLSLDDLDLFSGKPELIEARYISETITLVPFINDKSVQIANFEDSTYCQGFNSKQDTSDNPVNTIYLVPREIFSLELKQLDPFSSMGRQVIYVDAQTMLPFLKEVYNQNGSIQKTLIAAYTPVKSNNSAGSKGEEIYFVTKLLAAFGKSGQHSTLRTTTAKVCNQIPKDIPENFFEPTGF